jgi:hypothetical protein
MEDELLEINNGILEMNNLLLEMGYFLLKIDFCNYGNNYEQ